MAGIPKSIIALQISVQAAFGVNANGKTYVWNYTNTIYNLSTQSTVYYIYSELLSINKTKVI